MLHATAALKTKAIPLGGFEKSGRFVAGQQVFTQDCIFFVVVEKIDRNLTNVWKRKFRQNVRSTRLNLISFLKQNFSWKIFVEYLEAWRDTRSCLALE